MDLHNAVVVVTGASRGIGAATARHFAEHGLRAAQVARLQAERAYDEGDEPASRWWIEICRTLDGRMARQCERAFGIDDPLIH